MVNKTSFSKPPFILLAEDDDDDIYLFQKGLADGGIDHALHVTRNGEELIEALDDISPRQPDIIFLDVNMPKKNGFDSIKRIRESYSRKIPVFFLSTSPCIDTVENAQRLGATGYLSKPHSFSGWTTLLANILSRKWTDRSTSDFYLRLEYAQS